MDGISVEIHSKDDCIFCTRAKEWLGARGIAYEETRHDDQAERNAFYDSLGLKGKDRSVPQMFLVDTASGDRTYVGGFSELENSGL